MRNPFKINFLWLSIVIILCSFILFSECKCCYSYSGTFKNIVVGILSSAILLLLAELIYFNRDGSKFNFLAGKYKRIEIYQVNENKERWVTGQELILKGGKLKIKVETENLSFENNLYTYKNNILTVNDEDCEYKNDSCYHRLVFYDKLIHDKKIELKYLYNGKYLGIAQYHEGETKISLTLDSANEMQGKGTYQYINRRDLGTYEIQVDEINKNRIYLYYKNTIPSGLAEGYEIWEKI